MEEVHPTSTQRKVHGRTGEENQENCEVEVDSLKGEEFAKERDEKSQKFAQELPQKLP